PVNAGYYTSDEQTIKLEVEGKIKSEEDLKNMMIKTSSGLVTLRDVADITREYAEPQKNGFWIDGKPAIALLISMEPDAIVPKVGKRTRSEERRVGKE